MKRINIQKIFFTLAPIKLRISVMYDFRAISSHCLNLLVGANELKNSGVQAVQSTNLKIVCGLKKGGKLKAY